MEVQYMNGRRIVIGAPMPLQTETLKKTAKRGQSRVISYAPNGMRVVVKVK